jgi:ATP-binding cassette, subfamily A (ABC1), member 3
MFYNLLLLIYFRFFRFIPIFSFGYGLVNISNISLYKITEFNGETRSPYDLDVAGADLLFLIVMTFVYMIGIFIVEKL